MIFNAKVNKSTSRLKPAGLARNRISEDRISEEACSYFSSFFEEGNYEKEIWNPSFYGTVISREFIHLFS